MGFERLVVPWVVVVAACGDPAAFTTSELALIRAKLGPLPAAPPADPSNAFADQPGAASLGHKLFFEPRYSANGQVSCATCHDPATGFQDARANTSTGLGPTGRHAPTVLDGAFGGSATPYALWCFWDGRSDSQWSQALGPPENDVEMGGARTGIAYLIHDKYKAEYEAVFAPLPVLRDANGTALYPLDARPGRAAWDAMSTTARDDVTTVYVNFGKAIAAYERRLVTRGARFDAFHAEIAAGESDSELLSDREKEGLRLFLGKGACIECHDGPALSDAKFHNIGVSQVGPNLPSEDRGRAAGIATVLGSEFNCASRWSDHPSKAECPSAAVVAEASDLGAFKTPTLRNLSLTAPYMHTGTFATLADVIDHYDNGGDEGGFVGTIDDRVAPLGLTDSEKQALLAFLLTFDDEPVAAELAARPTLPE